MLRRESNRDAAGGGGDGEGGDGDGGVWVCALQVDDR